MLLRIHRKPLLVFWLVLLHGKHSKMNWLELSDYFWQTSAHKSVLEPRRLFKDSSHFYPESSQTLPLWWDCITPWRTQSPSQSGNTSSLREHINHICRSRSPLRSGQGWPRRAVTGDYCRSAASHQRPPNYLLSLRSSLQQRRITVLGTHEPFRHPQRGQEAVKPGFSFRLYCAL